MCGCCRPRRAGAAPRPAAVFPPAHLAAAGLVQWFCRNSRVRPGAASRFLCSVVLLWDSFNFFACLCAPLPPRSLTLPCRQKRGEGWKGLGAPLRGIFRFREEDDPRPAGRSRPARPSPQIPGASLRLPAVGLRGGCVRGRPARVAFLVGGGRGPPTGLLRCIAERLRNAQLERLHALVEAAPRSSRAEPCGRRDPVGRKLQSPPGADCSELGAAPVPVSSSSTVVASWGPHRAPCWTPIVGSDPAPREVFLLRFLCHSFN